MFADNAYARYHGSDEGLADLQALAKRSALPPADFKLKSASEIAEERRAQFEQSNPELALWMKIKAALTAPDGPQYFESQLKNSGVPELRGTVMEQKPACHPTELLVAVPLPDAEAKTEIRLKLDKPLAGKAEAGSELHWTGVPSAFTADPFLLTMDTESTTVKTKLSPCTAGPARKK